METLTKEQAARARAQQLLHESYADYPMLRDRLTSLLLDHACELDKAILGGNRLANTLRDERDAALRDLAQVNEALEAETRLSHDTGVKLLEARADLDAARARLQEAKRLLVISRERRHVNYCKCVDCEDINAFLGNTPPAPVQPLDGPGSPDDPLKCLKTGRWCREGSGCDCANCRDAPAPVQARLQSSGLTTTDATDRELVAAMLAIPCPYCAAPVGKPCAGERTFCMDRFTRRFDLTAGTKPAPVQAETEYCEHGTPVELTDMCTGCKATPSAAAPVRDGVDTGSPLPRCEATRNGDRCMGEAKPAHRYHNGEHSGWPDHMSDVPPSPHLDSAPPKEGK